MKSKLVESLKSAVQISSIESLVEPIKSSFEGGVVPTIEPIAVSTAGFESASAATPVLTPMLEPRL